MHKDDPGSSHTPCDLGQVAKAHIGHGDRVCAGHDADDTPGCLPSIDLEGDLVPHFYAWFLFQEEGVDDHGVFILGQQPAPLHHLGMHEVTIGFWCAEKNSFPFRAIGVHQTHVAESPRLGGDDARHARRLAFDLVDAIPPLEHNVGIVEHIVEHVVEGQEQRCAHAEHGDENGATQRQGDQGEYEPPLAAKGVAQRQ